jgi:hypothetical protein
MMRSKGIGGATAQEMAGYHAARKPKRTALVMPEDMEDQPPMAQIEEATRRRDMGRAYDRASKPFAKGGSIDGCAQRGKTKGRMV